MLKRSAAMPNSVHRKTPEELLRDCQTEEAEATRGRLKIVLGYASGVGKSYRMLDEARRRRERGQDIVVGAVQPQVSPEVDVLLKNLEVMPLRKIGDGTAIDVDALIRRHPTVCFIDGLAYNNPPGANNPARWQDVQDLLNAGIKVIASINIQYVEELRDEVEAITGKSVKETVPVSLIKSADEIEIVDAPAEEHPSKQNVGTANRTQQLSKLREITLVLAADVVDHQLNEYLERHGIPQRFGATERILICVTPRANIQEMLEVGLIIADRFHGELFVAYVNQPNLSIADRTILEEKLMIARATGAHVEILEAGDPADALFAFAQSRGVTQLFVGHTQRSGIKAKLLGSPIDKLIRLSEEMDVRVFPQ